MDENRIKHELLKIKVEPEELARMRAGLKAKMAEKPSYFQGLPRFFMPVLAIALAGITLISIFTFPKKDDPDLFATMNLEEIQRLVLSKKTAKLEQDAKKEYQISKGLEKGNAALVFLFLAPWNSAYPVAVERLKNEKRPDFKAAILEMVLDREDALPFSERELEQLIENEKDFQCRNLLEVALKERHLLKAT